MSSTRRAMVLAALSPIALAGVAHALPGSLLAGEPPMVARADAGAERLRAVRVGTTVAPPPPTTTVAPATSNAVAEVVRLTNLERVGAGLAPLAVDATVERVAAAHSADQASRGTMSHTGSDGSDAGDRLTRAGYAWTAWGENVAMGYPTASSVVIGWMGSPGHRANILNGTFTTIGVGVVEDAAGRPYWTMVLARP